ncbi:MAG: DDE-type integrase/transposase/recombinase [Nitrososphaerota archaeon]|nr:DDE-type integrase/transposase/recombinase [Nitrososphaerota archaeon]
MGHWFRKYVSLMDGYLDQIFPQLVDHWRADELYVKIRGNRKYLFAMMDDETRFSLAQEVPTGRRPTTRTTCSDGPRKWPRRFRRS